MNWKSFLLVVSVLALFGTGGVQTSGQISPQSGTSPVPDGIGCKAAFPKNTVFPPNFDCGHDWSRQDWADSPGVEFVRFTGKSTRGLDVAVGSGGSEALIVSSYDSSSGRVEVGTRFPLRRGHQFGRAWLDFNGDGWADYCRVLYETFGSAQGRLACTLSTGKLASIGETVYYPAESRVFDAGYHGGRFWADVNNDGFPDYCRTVGDGIVGNPARVMCTLAAQNGGKVGFVEDSTCRSNLQQYVFATTGGVRQCP